MKVGGIYSLRDLRPGDIFSWWCRYYRVTRSVQLDDSKDMHVPGWAEVMLEVLGAESAQAAARSDEARRYERAEEQEL